MLTTAFLVILTGIYNVYNLIRLGEEEKASLVSILLEEADSQLEEQVETALSVIEDYAKQAEAGKITKEEAQINAKNAIKGMRYGKDGYFWIDNTKGELIAHPITPEKEGTNRIDIEDPTGNKLVQNIIEAATTKSGFTNFQWEKPEAEQGQLTNKRVYSALYEPWEWIVSTGTYLDSMENSIAAKEISMRNNYVNGFLAIAIGVVISLLASFIISLWLSRKISKPVVQLVESFGKDEEGRIRIQEVQVSTKDEIGQLANTLNVMSQQVRTFIESVDEEAKMLVEASGSMHASAEELNEHMTVVSGTTEELAGGMEETAASCEEMNAATEQMTEVMQDMAVKTEGISQAVDEIAKRSSTIKATLTETGQETKSLLQDTREDLMHSIEEAKSVNEIYALADVIVQITEQTNLLALNANIEAARAGEAGAGFAIVAEEIRKLAENSKGTASDIQQIIKEVTQAVEHLSDNANRLIEFIETRVTKDYEFMLESSESYSHDTQTLNDLRSEVGQTSEALRESISSVAQAIGEITASANEGASNTTDIAHSVSSANHHTSQMSEQSDKLKENAEHLKALLSRFKL